MGAYDGLNSNWSRVVNGQTVEPEGIIEPSDVVVVGNLAAREWRIRITMRTEWRLLRHWWCGVFLDSAISPPIPASCSSHTEACDALGATDGITS